MSSNTISSQPHLLPLTQPCLLLEIAQVPLPRELLPRELSLNHDEDHDEDLIWKCRLSADDALAVAGVPEFEVGIDKEIFASTQYFNDDEPLPGESTFFSRHAVIDTNEYKIVVPTNDDPIQIGSLLAGINNNNQYSNNIFASTIQSSFHAPLSRWNGDKSFLVVSVSGNDHSPSPSIAAMRESVFGTDYSLSQQLAGCSHDKMTLTKATGDGVVNGVYDLHLNENVNGEGSYDVHRKAVTALTEHFGGNLGDMFDFVMLCLPDQVSFGSAAAYAYINNHLSVYRGPYCDKVGILMHEVGHNINLAHSGESGSTYGDTTGAMGAGSSLWTNSLGGSCYNPSKSWQLGWYADRNQLVTLVPNAAPETIKLVGVINYDPQETDEFVVTKINGINSNDYYIGFNHEEGIHEGTNEARDEVTIVMQGGAGVSYSQSWLQAKLGSGEDIVFENYNGQEDDLHVSVKSIDAVNGFAMIEVFSTNPDAPSPETNAPTVAPTIETEPDPNSDTLSPTSSPSSAPTATASASPSASPTASPSAAPTATASASPSASPTASPSAAPTATASVSPSASPTASPSATASVSPSASPSASPTASPSAAPTQAPNSETPAPTGAPTGAPKWHSILQESFQNGLGIFKGFHRAFVNKGNRLILKRMAGVDLQEGIDISQYKQVEITFTFQSRNYWKGKNAIFIAYSLGGSKMKFLKSYRMGVTKTAGVNYPTFERNNVWYNAKAVYWVPKDLDPSKAADFKFRIRARGKSGKQRIMIKDVNVRGFA